jgi:tetratricopeptide (TPR) repeat protein
MKKKSTTSNSAQSTTNKTKPPKSIAKVSPNQDKEIQALFQQAFNLHQQQKLSDAQLLYRKVLAQQPHHFDSLHLLGVSYAQQQKNIEAEKWIGQALLINPNHHAALANFGNTMLAMKRKEEALQYFDKAIACKADYADAHRGRGDVLVSLGKDDVALECYQRALDLEPNHALGLLHIAELLKKLQRCKEAEEMYLRYIAINPNHFLAHFNLGFVRIQNEDFVGAEAAFRSALQLEPNNADAYGNLGIALQKQHQHQESLSCYRKAIELNPNHADALSNLGLLLQELNQPKEAMESYNRALKIRPDFANAIWNKSLSLLLYGDFDQGWEMYEWRWKSVQQSQLRRWVKPRWDGVESLQGKAILLYPEQGLGDTLQFCRYAQKVIEMGAKVILEVQPPLQSLIRMMPQVSEVVAMGQMFPMHDYQFPLMSLPLIFKTNIDNIPAHIPYLYSDAALREVWQKRLGPKTKPRIGIAWSGRPAHNNDHNRSMLLKDLLPILPAQFEWISVQKDVREVDLETLKQSGIRHFGEQLIDFSDTAALVDCLDLVLSVDTSVVHLAGALGKQVWTLLPEVPDWRWLTKREDTPWYPNMRLYRQSGGKQWQPVLQRVMQDLMQWSPSQQSTPITPPIQMSELAMFQQAHALHERGEIVVAQQRYQQLLAINPKHFDALHLYGVALAQSAKFSEAEQVMQQAININPNIAALWSNRGNALSSAGRIEEALGCYQTAISLDENHVQAWQNLASSYKDLQRWEEGLKAYTRLLQLNPNAPQGYSGRGFIYKKMARHQESLDDYSVAIKLEPMNEKNHCNHGLLLSDLGRHEEALISYNRAIELSPNYAIAFYNRGLAMHRMLRLDEAIEDYNKAIQLQPNFHDAHWNKALVLLLSSRLTEAWPEYEWRWYKPEAAVDRRDFAEPLWLGKEDVRGRTILLYAEQGLGDTIQFSRYAEQVEALGAKVILEVQIGLNSLLAQLPGISQILVRGQELPKFDMVCPLMSLPHAFNTKLDSIPASIPYLHAYPEKIAEWQEKLGPRQRPRIGLVWSGRQAYLADKQRSMSLERWLPYLSKDLDWISLQKEVRESDVAALTSSNIRHFGDQLKDFSDTAALCQLVDLVISVDTSVVHLAGAMGRPVWVLLPASPDWRWMLKRSDSPWYPSATLFRQDAQAGWDEVLQRVADALAQQTFAN